MNPALPDFVIIGASKSGTTSLMKNLNCHPEIDVCSSEPHYFDHHLERGDAWYKSLFRDNGKLQGEKSPGYIFFTDCHERMKRLIPEAKLILGLRNPVSRAFSHWNMKYNDGRLFQGHLRLHKLFPGRLKGLGLGNILDCYLQNLDDPDFIRMNPLDIIGRGIYAPQISNLFKYYDRNQVYIVIFEDLIQNSPKTYNEIFSFLGVPPFNNFRNARYNAGSYRKKMNPDLQKKMHDFYEPYNEQLYELLGHRFPEWDNSSFFPHNK